MVSIPPKSELHRFKENIVQNCYKISGNQRFRLIFFVAIARKVQALKSGSLV
jgi:hypothetical protein